MVLGCGALFATDLFAEDQHRGRLADGRAFRTDDQGNQLVDYIAELEVNIESLERQVRGLEDENRSKQAAIARLQKGDKAEGTLTERSILPTASEAEKKCVCPQCDN